MKSLQIHTAGGARVTVWAGMAAVLGLMLWAPGASATTIVGDAAAKPLYEQWIAESDVGTPAGEIRVVERRCTLGGSTVCARPRRDPPVIIAPDWSYFFTDAGINRRWQTVYQFEFMRAVGRIRDWDTGRRLWAPYRVRYLRLLGMEPSWVRTWWGCFKGLCLGWGESETFADAYAFCAIDSLRLSRWHLSGWGYRPTWTRHRRVCRMLQRPWNRPIRWRLD